ncbi:MAG: hypothetical protein V4722_28345 [Bacteroidota bacterium]
MKTVLSYVLYAALVFIPATNICSQIVDFPNKYPLPATELKILVNCGVSATRFENARALMFNNESALIYETKIKNYRHLGIGIGKWQIQRNKDSLNTSYVQTYSGLKLPVYYRQYYAFRKAGFLFWDIGVAYNFFLNSQAKTNINSVLVKNKQRYEGSSFSLLIDLGIRFPVAGPFNFEFGLNGATDFAGIFSKKANKLMTERTNLFIAFSYELR